MVSYATVRPFGTIIRGYKHRLVPWTGAVTLGGLGTLCIGAYPWAALLVLGVVAFVHRSYAASVVEQQARQHSEQVQAAIVTLRTHTDPQDVRRTCVATTKELLGAGQSEIVSEKVTGLRRAPTAFRSSTASGCGSTSGSVASSGTTATATPC